jgi:hypothetical protein
MYSSLLKVLLLASFAFLHDSKKILIGHREYQIVLIFFFWRLLREKSICKVTNIFQRWSFGSHKHMSLTDEGIAWLPDYILFHEDELDA